MNKYNLTNIRLLLTKGFSSEELRTFCFDRDVFRPVFDKLTQNLDKEEIITRLIEYAEYKQLVELLLNWAKELNPARYADYQPYVLPPGPGNGGETTPPPPPEEPTPFIGPRPFNFDEGHLFFGREKCLNELVEKLKHWPIVVVNGLSGTGKTSLLRAGLVPRLKKEGYSVAYASIVDSPKSDVVRGIQGAFRAADNPDMSILNAVKEIACLQSQHFVLVVDQVERCFYINQDTVTQDTEERLGFWRGIAQLLAEEAPCEVKLVIAIRLDWLGAFQNVPTPLGLSVFDFLFQVKALNIKEASEALTGPLEQLGIPYQEELIDSVLKDLAVVDDLTSVEGRVNPPELQIVGEALYQHMTQVGHKEEKLTLEDYQFLRGARAIIRERLTNTVNKLSENAPIGWRILLKLVGVNDQRVSKREEDLRGNLSEEKFNSIILQLADARLVVREISSVDRKPVYTLTHDYLIEEINEQLRVDEKLRDWKIAEHYLETTGLSDWQYTKEHEKKEVFLERDRYLHIYSQKEAFEDLLKEALLEEEANIFLLETGLYHGEASFSDWLPEEPDSVTLRTIMNYCLHKDYKIRRAARTAVIKAIHKNTLNDKYQKSLAECLLYIGFGIRKEPQNSVVNEIKMPEGQLTKQEREESAAVILWSLRRFTDFWQQQLRYVPVAASVWFADHRKQIIIPAFSVLAFSTRQKI